MKFPATSCTKSLPSYFRFIATIFFSFSFSIFSHLSSSIHAKHSMHARQKASNILAEIKAEAASSIYSKKITIFESTVLDSVGINFDWKSLHLNANRKFCTYWLDISLNFFFDFVLHCCRLCRRHTASIFYSISWQSNDLLGMAKQLISID